MAAILLIAVATCNLLDEAHFATIVHFWEQNLPSRDFELLGYMSDGPHGSRLHVPVQMQSNTPIAMISVRHFSGKKSKAIKQ